MANPIEIALTQVLHSIPSQILESAFYETHPSGLRMPIHEVIRKRVIEGRVLKECNVLGGNAKDIPLLSTYEEPAQASTGFTNSFSTNVGRIYRIPPEIRDGVEIIEIMHVTPPSYSVPQIGPIYGVGQTGATFEGLGSRVIDSYTGAGFIHTPMAELLSGEMVRLTPGTMDFIDWILTVRLSYDRGFNNLNSSAIMSLTALILAATKSYIYTRMIVDLEKFAHDGGQPLGRIVSIVESYEPAEEEYRERLTKFAGAAFLSPARLKTFLAYRL